MKSSLLRLNPQIPEEVINDVVKSLVRDYTGTDIVATNYDLYNKIRNQIQVKVKRNGKEDFDFVKLVDFDNPQNNTFTAVSQMWIQGKVYWRRPDVLIFVNGLPLVFIELKTVLSRSKRRSIKICKTIKRYSEFVCVQSDLRAFKRTGNKTWRI